MYLQPISLGNVAQIDLGNSPAGQQVMIEWALAGEESTNDGPASFEITEIFGASPSYDQKRYYVQGVSARSNEAVSSAYSSLPGVGNCPGFTPGEYTRCANMRTVRKCEMLN